MLKCDGCGNPVQLVITFSFESNDHRVHADPGKPGKLTGILLWHFPGLESPGKRPLVLESFGNLLNSTKKYEVYGRQ